MELHLSGRNPYFVDGELEKFRTYATNKIKRVNRVSNADVLHVRFIPEGKNGLIKVSVDVDGEFRTFDTGKTTFEALDKALDTLIERLKAERDKNKGKNGNIMMASLLEPDESSEQVLEES